MYWPSLLHWLLDPSPRHVWVTVRILRETRKAILVETATELWIPKSAIRAIRLRGCSFQIYVPERMIG